MDIVDATVEEVDNTITIKEHVVELSRRYFNVQETFGIFIDF
jgi:hypothetical protein